MGRANYLPLFVNLGGSLFVSWIIWSHYANVTYPVSERYSTFWPRFWESTIDQLVFWPFQLLFVALTRLHLGATPLVCLMIAQDLSYWTYSVAMHARYGQTLGKMVCKVKILDAKTEAPIGFKQALLRDIVPIVFAVLIIPLEITTMRADVVPATDGSRAHGWTGPEIVVSSIAGLWFLIEVVTMLTNKRRRALHDFIAGTIVVRTTIGEGSLSGAPKGALNLNGA